MSECRVCGTVGGTSYVAKETMYGLPEHFRYFECEACGCLQIEEIPADLERYYGDGYYSFASARVDGVVARLLKRKRAKFYIQGRSALGWLVSRVSTPPQYLKWLKNARVDFNDRVLDVGCGAGVLLSQLRSSGFTKVTGLDPYVNAANAEASGLRILRTTLTDVHEDFDFVMLHHSFEHMPEPLESLRNIHRILARGRYALVRIPVVSSYAWKAYGTNWVQVDAPRHVCLHTERSLGILASKAGFHIDRIEYDSTAFQFWGSEQCIRSVPLSSPTSYAVDREKSTFTVDEIQEYTRRAVQLNERGEGDQAAFYLRKL